MFLFFDLKVLELNYEVSLGLECRCKVIDLQTVVKVSETIQVFITLSRAAGNSESAFTVQDGC